MRRSSQRGTAGLDGWPSRQNPAYRPATAKPRSARGFAIRRFKPHPFDVVGRKTLLEKSGPILVRLEKGNLSKVLALLTATRPRGSHSSERVAKTHFVRGMQERPQAVAEPTD